MKTVMGGDVRCSEGSHRCWDLCYARRDPMANLHHWDTKTQSKNHCSEVPRAVNSLGTL